MKVNVSTYNTQDGIDSNLDQNEFLPKYRELLNFISQNNLMDSIEETYRVYYSYEVKPNSMGVLNNIILLLFNNQIEFLNTFNMYMQNLNIDYPNKASGNSQINSRLKKLKIIYSRNLVKNNMIMAEPFNINSSLASIQKNSPNINVNLSRNDGEEFYATFNFNTLMNLINQLTNVLSKKLEVGNNVVNIQLLNNYIESSDKFKLEIEKFKKKKDILD